MQVQEVMSKRVQTIGQDDTIRAAARRMRDADIGALPVAKDDRLIGMLTDRDIVTRVLGAGKDPDQVRVEEAMTGETKYCFADEECGHVAANMAELGVLRLPVMDRDKRLVGIVSAGDLQSLAGATAANDTNADSEVATGRGSRAGGKR